MNDTYDLSTRISRLLISGVTSARQMPLQVCARHKVVPIVLPPVAPTLAATSHIPNLGGLVNNINNLAGGLQQRGNTARSTGDFGSINGSSNYSADPDSLQAPVSAWPSGSVSRRVKKLSWDDDDEDGEHDHNDDVDKVRKNRVMV